MWDALGRWKVVWHLSIWQYHRRVWVGVGSAWVYKRGWGEDDMVGVESVEKKGVFLCVRACDRRDIHWVTKQILQMWVGVLSLSKARFIQQPSGSPGIHSHLALHWGLHSLPAHYQPQAKLWTFVYIQPNWYDARPHIVAWWKHWHWSLWYVKAMHHHHHLELLITQWRRGVRCRMMKGLPDCSYF